MSRLSAILISFIDIRYYFRYLMNTGSYPISILSHYFTITTDYIIVSDICIIVLLEPFKIIEHESARQCVKGDIFVIRDYHPA